MNPTEPAGQPEAATPQLPQGEPLPQPGAVVYPVANAPAAQPDVVGSQAVPITEVAAVASTPVSVAPVAEPQIDTPVATPTPTLPPHPVPNVLRVSRLGMFGAGALTVTVIFIAVAASWWLFFRGTPQQRLVTSFLQQVSTRNYRGAYKITSKEFQASINEENFRTITSTQQALYSGFKKQTPKQTNSKPSFLEYEGTITYDDKLTGAVIAKFKDEDGGLKIDRIEITVSPQRIEKFQK